MFCLSIIWLHFDSFTSGSHICINTITTTSKSTTAATKHYLLFVFELKRCFNLMTLESKFICQIFCLRHHSHLYFFFFFFVLEKNCAIFRFSDLLSRVRKMYFFVRLFKRQKIFSYKEKHSKLFDLKAAKHSH